jgi:two-component system, LuxR family, response regulator FixJ
MTGEVLVHVIDDDEAVRESLEFLLRSAGMRVRTYETAKDFLELLAEDGSGCVLTDVRMPGMSGIELLRHLQAMKYSLPVIVMTGHGDVPLAIEAMKCGAVDFLEKPFDDEILLAAVRSALARDEDGHGAREREREVFALRTAALSGRERQVLEALVTGHPNKTVAHDLGLSARTVETYRAKVMSKMEAASLSELVRMALVAGLFPDRP